MELDYLIIFISFLALISHGDNANSSVSTIEPAVLVNDVALANTTVSIVNLEQSTQSGFLAHGKSLLITVDNWLSKFFNKSSFILSIAFILGFITLAAIILLSICLYKNLCGKKSSYTDTKITTNPAYDKIPKVDFLDSSESLNNKIKGSVLGGNLESPDSKISSETIRLLDIKSEDKNEPNLVKTLSNQSIKSFSSSSTSKNSVIDQTPKIIKQTQPTLASLNDSNIKSSLSNLSKKLNSSHNLEKSALLADDESLSNKIRFTPNSKKYPNRQQMNIEEQISRRSLVFNRSKSESVTESGLPPVPPQDKSKQRVSIASSIGSIANGQITMDFSHIKQGVDNILKDIKPYDLSSSSISINPKPNQVSMSDIYRQAIREKCEKRHSVANLNQDSESIMTYGSEKSCY